MIDISDARLRLSESGVGITTDVILSAALDELEAARQRISELEDRIVYDPVTKQKIIRGVIISEPGDAEKLGFLLSGEWNPRGCGCAECMKSDAVIRRYLAVIEGQAPGPSRLERLRSWARLKWAAWIGEWELLK